MAYTAKQLTMAWTATHGGVEPNAETASVLTLMANPSFSDQQALDYILRDADSTTAVAALSYQFFTGKSPTQAGLAYLVNSSSNPNDLNDGYYARFNLENRFINFAANLGVNGEGAKAFADKYGAMSFADYVASIYETVIGSTYAKAAGVDVTAAIAYLVGTHDAVLASARNSGAITDAMTAAQADLALKAAMAGLVMAAAVKADIGLYAGAANNFMLALAEGKATYNTDLTATYKPGAVPGSDGLGHTVVTPPTSSDLPGGPPPVVVTPPVVEPEPEPPAVSHAFVLTTGADTFVGEGASDTFTATLGNSATLNGGDSLDGGAGDDTLSITNTNATNFALGGATVRNIEHLRVKTTGAVFTLNVAGITGITELVNDGSTRILTVSNIGAVAKMAITGVDTRSTTFSYAGAALAGNADLADLTLTNVTSAAPVKLTQATAGANAFETLNLVSNGAANSITLATDASQTSLSRINISGAAPLTLALTASDNILTSATTIDAHAATGGVTIGSATTSLGAANHTIILGTGSNLVYFGANLTAADTVTATAGSDDTVAVSASITSAIAARLAGVETIRFTAGTVTQDAQQLPGSVTHLQVAGSADLTLTNLANNTTVESLGGVSLGMGLASNTGSDALTLKLTSGTLSTLSDVTGLETLNIVSNGGVIANDNVTAKHVVTGSANLTITNAPATHDFDASALTGNLTLTLSSGADTVKAGSGNDTINLRPSNATPTHSSNGGGDTITLGAGNDTLFLSDNLGSGNGGDANYANSPRITDFHVGASSADTDFLRFNSSFFAFQLTPTGGAATTGLARGSVASDLLNALEMTVQTLGSGDGAVAATPDVTFIKLTSPATLGADIKHVFMNAIGGASITGLAANGNFVVSAYDSGSHQMLLAVVNVGGSGAGDTVLSATDFTDTTVALIGVLDMTAGDYTSLSATHMIIGS